MPEQVRDRPVELIGYDFNTPGIIHPHHACGGGDISTHISRLSDVHRSAITDLNARRKSQSARHDLNPITRRNVRRKRIRWRNPGIFEGAAFTGRAGAAVTYRWEVRHPNALIKKAI